MRPDLISRVPEMDPSLHFSTCGDNRVDPSNMDIGVVSATTSPTPKLEWGNYIKRKWTGLYQCVFFCTFC